ncbi:MAG TPA: hypothetical protein VIT23_02615, partial [Terrimicrobiaceae bacterium]
SSKLINMLAHTARNSAIITQPDFFIFLTDPYAALYRNVPQVTIFLSCTDFAGPVNNLGTKHRSPHELFTNLL